MDGFLLIDKPVGMTSHDVVFKVKRKLGLAKIGHTGTLDPFASGLLILCLGKATKLAYLFQNQDKRYEGSILFGKHHDTYDITGQLMHEETPNLSHEQIQTAMEKMVGTYAQKPPMFSAIKQKGKKLYELARKGIEVEIEPRHVDILAFHTTSRFGNNTVDFYAHVSKGTYIRSLAVDLAANLKTYATLKSLRRIQVGSYPLDQATTLESLNPESIINLKAFFADYPKLILNDYLIHLVKNGIKLDERQTKIAQGFVVYSENDEMIAYYEPIQPNQYQLILLF